MKKLFFIALLFIYSNGSFSEDFNVVYHLNEREKVGVLIASIHELLQSSSVNKIEVVIHGPAIVRLAKDDGLSDAFEDLIKKVLVSGLVVFQC